MNARQLHEVNQLRHEFERVLGRYPDSWRFETADTLRARIGENTVFLTTYPDGALKFDDDLARALNKNVNASTMILGGSEVSE